MSEDRRWMYEGWNNGKPNINWVRKTDDFVNRAFSIPNAERDGVLCPCLKCANYKKQNKREMSIHLFKNGFMPRYLVWIEHGERVNESPALDETFPEIDHWDEMLTDVVNFHQPSAEEEAATAAANNFYELLEASKEPVHKETTMSILSAVTRLMSFKTQHNMYISAYDTFLMFVHDLLPKDSKLPAIFSESKKLLSSLGMPYEKIDACVNGCMLFRKENKDKSVCDYCNEPRYVQTNSQENSEDSETRSRPIARKVLRYLPIIPRIQRLYLVEESAKQMQYHKEGHHENPELLVHPSDDEAWKSFDRAYPRAMGKFKKWVKNKARVEGCITEAYIVDEISNFVSLYFASDVPSSRNKKQRVDDGYDTFATGCSLSTFQVPGKKYGNMGSCDLSRDEHKPVMLYIYTNTLEMEDFVKQFEQTEWRGRGQPTSHQLDKLRKNGAARGHPNLIDWFRSYCMNTSSINKDLARISHGCRTRVLSLSGYDVNGYRFRSAKNWKEVPFSRKSRMPNTVLGALLRYHYPQKVYDKTSQPPADVPATKWQHWYMKGELGDTMADRVKNDFKEDKYGRPFGVLEGYAIHAGASREEVANLENKDMPEITNTRAQEYMEQYHDAMIERNGKDVDWLHGPFDPQVMYESTGGKPHGRFAVGDGAFDSESVRLNCSAGDTSEFQRAKRQREENDFDQRLQDREREFVERMKQREMEIITQVHQNSNEATIQRTGDSSFGYRQAEHNIANDGIQPPTRGTSGTGNGNMGENVHGSHGFFSRAA
ncbi:hypothetical protein ACQ4PT_025374 [Festuca glaucescens]